MVKVVDTATQTTTDTSYIFERPYDENIITAIIIIV